MEKTIKLLLRPNGDLVSNDQVEDKMAGFQSENNATTLEIEIPSALQSLSQYIEILSPNGNSMSSEVLTVSSGKITLPLASSTISEQGRYAVQWVGRNLSTGLVVKSSIIALDVDPSINAMEVGSSNTDFITWATNQLDDLDTRLTALENDESAEVHADSEFSSDGYIVVVSGSSGKIIKQGTKTIAQILEDAASDATTKASNAINTAANDATTKAANAKAEAISAAASDATSKVAAEALARQNAVNEVAARVLALENGESAEVSADNAFGTDAVIIIADGATGKKIKSSGVTLAALYATLEATQSEIDSIWEAQ